MEKTRYPYYFQCSTGTGNPTPPLKKFHRVASRTIFLFGGITGILFLATLGLKIVSMPLKFDEYLNAHYLWLISIGRVPHIDFWCHYSASGFVIVRPFFKLFHESIYSIIALRYFGLCFFLATAVVLAYHAHRLRTNWLWGVLPLAVMLTPEVTPFVVNFRTDAYAALAAIMALAIMFREPSPLRNGLVTGLSVLSVIIMPKYVYPLVFALIAYLVYGYLKGSCKKRSLIISALAGGVISLVLCQGLLLTSRVRLWDDLYWSSIIMQKFFIHCAQTETSLTTQLTTVAFYFSKYWYVAILVLAGLSGWLSTELKRREVPLWVGTAIIAGVAVFLGTCRMPFLQFLVPGLYCLALFVPYAALMIKRPLLQTVGTAVLVIVAALTVFNNVRSTTADRASGFLKKDFYFRQELLKHIPRSGRVIGLFYTHPIFREDQTFVTWDEQWGKPKGFSSILPKNSRAFSYFQPEYLKHSLENSPPPATLTNDSLNYPPGWNQVLSDYLTQHADLYIHAIIMGKAFFIRRDLWSVPGGSR